MIICICKAVSERHIKNAIAAGSSTLDDLMVDLGVATGCGKCAECACALLDAAQCPSASALAYTGDLAARPVRPSIVRRIEMAEAA